MRELVRTNDPVLITAIEALLQGANIEHVVFDQNMSVLEGSIGMLPRRVMVADEQVAAARQLLTEAGLGHELRPDGEVRSRTPIRTDSPRTQSWAAGCGCASRKRGASRRP